MKINKKNIRPNLLLVLAFVLIMGFEAYLLYWKVYSNLTTEEATEIQTGNIVRLDLTSYNKALGILDSAKSFTIKTENLSNTNPFK